MLVVALSATTIYTQSIVSSPNFSFTGQKRNLKRPRLNKSGKREAIPFLFSTSTTCSRISGYSLLLLVVGDHHLIDLPLVIAARNANDPHPHQRHLTTNSTTTITITAATTKLCRLDFSRPAPYCRLRPLQAPLHTKRRSTSRRQSSLPSMPPCISTAVPIR